MFMLLNLHPINMFKYLLVIFKAQFKHTIPTTNGSVAVSYNSASFFKLLYSNTCWIMSISSSLTPIGLSRSKTSKLSSKILQIPWKYRKIISPGDTIFEVLLYIFVSDSNLTFDGKLVLPDEKRSKESLWFIVLHAHPVVQYMLESWFWSGERFSRTSLSNVTSKCLAQGHVIWQIQFSEFLLNLECIYLCLLLHCS